MSHHDPMHWDCVFRAGKKGIVLSVVLSGVIAGIFLRQYSRIQAGREKELSTLVASLVNSISAARRLGSARIRVALFESELDAGSATKELRRLLDLRRQIAWRTVNPSEIRNGILEGFDVAVFPGGSAPSQAKQLGCAGRIAVREFVRNGGGYVGICGGAFLALSQYKWGIGIVNAKPLVGKIRMPRKGVVSLSARGAGIVKIELNDIGRRIFGDHSPIRDVLYSGGPILLPGKADRLSQFVSLATFRTEISQFEAQRRTMIDTPAAIAGQFGRGRVILFSPHPEMTMGCESLVYSAISATARCRKTTQSIP